MCHDRRFVLIPLLILICSALILDSCSDESAKAKPKLTLILFSDDKLQIESIISLTEQFNKLNSGFVNVEVYGTKLEPFIIDSIANAGKQFDIMLVSAEYLNDLVNKGMLIELSKADSKLPKSIYNFGRFDNKQYGIPYDFNINLLFVNRKFIEKYNYTTADIEDWNDLIDIASDINSPDEHYGFGLAIDDACGIVQNLASFSSSTTIQDSGELSATGIATGINYLGELGRNGLIESASFLEDLFISGKLGFYIGSLDLAERINSTGSNKNYEMMSLPKLNASDMKSTVTGLILVASKNSDSTIIEKFIEFTTSSRENLLKSQQHRYTKEQAKLILETINSSIAFPKIDNWSDKKERIETEFIKIMKAEESYLGLLNIFNY